MEVRDAHASKAALPSHGRRPKTPSKAAAPEDDWSGSMTAGAMRKLQRSVGNRAVTGLLQSRRPMLQRMTPSQLNPGEGKDYAIWQNWAKSYKTLDVEVLLLHAPNYAAFKGFMQYLKQNIDLPPLGQPTFVSDFLDTALPRYFKKYPDPITAAPATVSAFSYSNIAKAGATTTTTTSGATHAPSPSSASSGAASAAPASPKDSDQFGVAFSARNHYHDHSVNGLPKSDPQLRAYVKNNLAHFLKVDGGAKGPRWTMQLGDIKTKEYGGGTMLEAWSLIFGPNTQGTGWWIFHFGPTSREKD